MLPRLSRRFAPLLTLLAALLTLVALAAPAASAQTLPPEGIFDDCSLGSQLSTCIQRLGVIHQGGFQVVVMQPSGSLADIAAYSTAAQNMGMKVMWSLSNAGWWVSTMGSVAGSFPSFSAACGCTSDPEVLAFTVHTLAQLPATYGYYAADDWSITAADRPSVARWVAAIKAADPHHTVLISASQQSQANQYQPIADTIGEEIYPVTTDSPDWQSVRQGASDAQHAADSAGKPSTFILQAFTFGDNLDDGEAVGACTPSMSKFACYNHLRYPSAAAQLTLRNQILQHAHPKLILWWSFQGTYGQAGNDTYSIYPTGATAAARWAGLSTAVRAPYPASAAQLAHQAAARKHRVAGKRHRSTRRHHKLHKATRTR